MDATPSVSRWGDLRLRVASALVLLPVALFCLIEGGWAWRLLVLAATFALLWEWWRMWSRLPGPVSRLGVGWAYMLVGALSLSWLRADPQDGLASVLFLLVVVWASDIGAYLFGRLIGGAKLAPAISPGKTRSGAVGGLAAAMIGGLLVAKGFGAAPGLAPVWVAAVLSVASQSGDLLESALKRHYGVKDSSRLIPGHGGVFDRLDGLLAAAPIAALIVLLTGELWP